MGIGNRARRAAKTKAKTKTKTKAKVEARAESGSRQAFGDSAFGGFGAPSGPGAPQGPPSVAELAAAVLEAADLRARGDAVAAAGCLDGLAELPGPLSGSLSRAVHMAAMDGLTHCWRTGWQPADLWQITRKRLPAAQTYLDDLLAADAARHSAAALAPAWAAQLSRLEVEVWWDADRPHLDQWAARHRTSPGQAVELVVEWLALVRRLPRMSELIPPPGSAAARSAAGRGARPMGVDDKVLTRVRALLAKAESTEFAEEADAFFAKAQELMTRYSLERAMLDAGADGVDGAPGGRRIWLDAPYVSAKTLLIDQVARANRARTVMHTQLDAVTVLGAEVDLELVEVLSTALLVHASTEMVSAGRQQDGHGRSRTKSFRQAFLVSYASRIGERLTAADVAVARTMSVGDDRLLPVLAARSAAVAEMVDELFPNLATKRVSVSNSAGWGAGRVAADLAELDVRRAVR